MTIHFIGVILSAIIGYIAVKIGKYAGYARDWSFIAYGFLLLAVARGLYFLSDLKMGGVSVYHIGLVMGTVGMILEIIGMASIAKRLKRLMKK